MTPKFKVGEKIVCSNSDFGNLGKIFVVANIIERPEDGNREVFGDLQLELETPNGEKPTTYYNSEKYYRKLTKLEQALR